jgi:mannose/cellobiose epimerase-like protein (N-acyl-D-glucosamine 2-epimerase family)
MGLRLIRHELHNHINLDGRAPNLRDYDFWETINDRGQPYSENGKILSDPGHALECVGLVLKFASTAKQLPITDAEQQAEIAHIETLMPRLLEHNFRNGFQPGPGGICKAFDLVSRTPINTDMPWWSLPETMRSAAFCWRLARTDTDRMMSLRIVRDCHNAFTRHFVRPDLHLMAYQTRSETGDPVSVIPATADADPGYHTGLSIIDVLDAIEGAPSD